jgi:hypothetical protein
MFGVLDAQQVLLSHHDLLSWLHKGREDKLAKLWDKYLSDMLKFGKQQ